MINRLTANEKSRASLLRYFDATWAPAIVETRLVHHHLHDRGTAWRAKLATLEEPERAAQPSQKPPKNRYDLNPALQSQIKQARQNMNVALKNFSNSGSSGTSEQDMELWNKVAKATAKFEAADAQREATEDEYAKEYAAWERKVESYKPVQAYDTAIQIARSELMIALIEAFNQLAPFDDVVTGREQFLGSYASFVPTHHFYLAKVQDGTYVYVYEQNQIDVHLHCRPFDGYVDLITVKRWGANAGFTPKRNDTYLGGKKGLTERPSHLSGVDQTYVNLVAHLRTNYPPANTSQAQKVEPKLPRQRGAV